MSAPTYQGTYTLPTIARGDTLLSWSVAITRNAAPASISSARLKIRAQTSNSVVDTLACTIDSNTVTVEAALGTRTAGWALGTHNYDLEVTLSTGVVRTYLRGTVTIVKDETY